MFTFFDLRKVVNTSCSLYKRAAVCLICASCVSVSTMARDIYTWQNVKIGGGGGFIPGIIYNESEKGLVYIRTDMGGLYRQDPTSKKWIPLTDFVSPEEWNMLGGESFATDPVEPNICYFAAGTYTNNWTNMNGMILRSTDYGNTWERYEMPIKFGGNMPGRSIGERLMIDPNCHSILYFGARSGNGLWKSIDSGKTWKKVSSFPVDGDFVQDPVQDQGRIGRNEGK
jgi:xyloglucan-specific exo-beta-1,4-glucanase